MAAVYNYMGIKLRTVRCGFVGKRRHGMRRKNIAALNELVEQQYADKLRKNGFIPYRDCTEWLRLKNGEIVQIILFYEYHYWLEVFFYSELLTEFQWFDYREHKGMDGIVGQHYCNVRRKFGLDVFTMNDVFDSGSWSIWAKTQELHRHLDYAIMALDEVNTPADIAALDVNEGRKPERICLYYENGDLDTLRIALKNASVIDPMYYDSDDPPERLKRDWRLWQVKTAFVARDVLNRQNLKLLTSFTEECRRSNIAYLKRKVPELWTTSETTDKAAPALP